MGRRQKLSTVLVLLVAAVLVGYLFGATKTRVQEIKENDLQKTQDTLMQRETETAVSMLEALNSKVKKGEMTLVRAQKLGADLLRDLRYGADKEGYFWADTTKGVNVVLYGNKEVEGKNRYEDKVNGVEYVKLIIEKGTNGGGFTDYYYPKKGETMPKAKRAYSLEFKPFGWVIGTGYYLEDVK